MATLSVEPGRVSEEDARRYAGKWVAIKNGNVLHASSDGPDLLDWVERTKAEPDLVTRLPREDAPEFRIF